MTHPGNEPTPIWLRVAPLDNPDDGSFWTRRVCIPRHYVVERAREPEHGAAVEDPATLTMGTWDARKQAIVVPA